MELCCSQVELTFHEFALPAVNRNTLCALRGIMERDLVHVWASLLVALP